MGSSYSFGAGLRHLAKDDLNGGGSIERIVGATGTTIYLRRSPGSLFCSSPFLLVTKGNSRELVIVIIRSVAAGGISFLMLAVLGGRSIRAFHILPLQTWYVGYATFGHERYCLLQSALENLFLRNSEVGEDQRTHCTWLSFHTTPVYVPTGCN